MKNTRALISITLAKNTVIGILIIQKNIIQKIMFMLENAPNKLNNTFRITI